MRLIAEFAQDVRYGRRLLAKNPGITLIAILTLALGIGANTAIFSVVNAFILRPLPYGDPDRLVMVDSQQRGQSIGVSFPDFEDWRKQNNVFDELAFFNLRWNAKLDFGTETETLGLTFATTNLFSTLQVAPLLGHGPRGEEPDTVLLSHGLWQRRFAGDPAIVGRQLRIDGRSLTVAGVMPPGFRFPFQSDLWWLNDRYFDRHSRDMRIDQTIGRLKPGVTTEQAGAEMQAIAARLAQTYPDTNVEVTASVVPLRDFWFGKVRRSFWLLLGACGFVLLIACANVANLLLTQATVRERELALRAALGASQGRLIRQSLSEALLLVSLGCALGIGLGWWSLRLLVALLPEEILPFFVKIELDSRALLFTLLIAVLTVLIVGLIPALRTTSVDLDQSLKEGGRSGTGAGLQRVRGLLVVTEIALAVVLLAGAGLMLRSLTRLQNTSPGFIADGVLHLEINPTYKRQEDYRVEFMSRHYQRLLQQVATVPGVVAVAAIAQSEEQYGPAIEYYLQALKIARSIEDVRTEGLCLMNIGITGYQKGAYRESIRMLDVALQIFTAIVDKYNHVIVLGDLGNSHAALGDSAKAFAHYDEVLTGARVNDDIRNEASVLFKAGQRKRSPPLNQHW